MSIIEFPNQPEDKEFHSIGRNFTFNSEINAPGMALRADELDKLATATFYKLLMLYFFSLLKPESKMYVEISLEGIYESEEEINNVLAGIHVFIDREFKLRRKEESDDQS